ncbi:ATP-binding protein [Sphingobium phenoxybenzoativorans]|uniref:ATP-binding protein n=1 Tax=Sphingobium phenoxybenzoativorans TaxID=1592790 RepID=UPI0014960EF9|nr:winged helix-turn-helix domain-containing protein [Sphingobium phenoxybenzoativorans]
MRLLERDGQPINIGSRALELLIALVERGGEVVSKRTLMARVWDGLTVDEGSLRFQIATLRRALGDGVDGARYISNVPGRGYCFVAPLAIDEPANIQPVAPRLQRQQFLRSSVNVIGREEIVDTITENLLAYRFVTIHGAGGIGKTTVATSIASAQAEAFDNNVVFLDLSPIKDPSLVVSALASALGLLVDSSDPTPAVLAMLKDMRALIVLDSCEHVVERAAALGESIYREAPAVAIIATSREPLRAIGERVIRLAPLDLPPRDETVPASALMQFPAARLFVERAAAAGLGAELNDCDAAVIAEMCHALDGMPLAIEIAASRAGQHGLAETAQLLDGRFRLRWRGRRSAMPRHQTLYETLDWSFELLSSCEKAALQQLSVFPGFFTLEAVQSMMADSKREADVIDELLENIVAKSMISVDLGDETARYRLLDTTRAYAHAKLAESGGAREIAHRHARFVADKLSTIDIASIALKGVTREATDLLGDLRVALPWTFSEQGDRSLGLRLAAQCGPFLIPFSLFDEAGRWIEHAMSMLDEAERGSALEMDLEAAHGAVLIMTQTNGERAQAALERALVIAERLGDSRVEYRLIYCMQLLRLNAGEFNYLLPMARRLEILADKIGEPHCATSALQMVACSHGLMGDQPLAQQLFEQVIKERLVSDPVSPADYAFVGDPWIGFSLTLWIRGYPDQAVRAAKLISTDSPSVLFSCMGLSSAAVVFREIGDNVSADFLGAKLREKARRYSMAPYQAVAMGFAGQSLVEQGKFAEAIDRLQEALLLLRAREYGVYGAIFARSLVKALGATGRSSEARCAVDARIKQINSIGGAYDLPEWLRIRGVLEAVSGETRMAEDSLHASIDLARRQGALSWELRSEISLARLMLDQGRGESVRARLEAVLNRFEEGFATGDLISASSLLEQLGHTIG